MLEEDLVLEEVLELEIELKLLLEEKMLFSFSTSSSPRSRVGSSERCTSSSS